jgi:general secretion pathway protein I
MRAGGFTLIEVLVALAVLAISLGAALRVGESSASVFAAARSRLLAEWVAADQLAELRARRLWPEIGVTEGNANEAGVEFHWRQTVAATANLQFRRIAVFVHAADDNRELPPLAEAVGHAWKGNR